jgi:hypothetical protein
VKEADVKETYGKYIKASNENTWWLDTISKEK